MDSDIWRLSKMLGYLKKEIEAKERATLTCASYPQIQENCEEKYSFLAIRTHEEKEKLIKGIKDYSFSVMCLTPFNGNDLKFQIQK